MSDGQYLCRVGALESVWACWAETGESMSEQQWSTATRCPGWDVGAVFAHVGMFPPAIVDPPPVPGSGDLDPVAAVDILRMFNAPGGVAHEMSRQVAQAALSVAAQRSPRELLALFTEVGPQALGAVRGREATSLVPWPATGRVTTWAEALRIVLLESVVHLLDVLDALGRAPRVPARGLQETAHLLADVAEPVTFIEAATGRSARSPLPVLR